MRIITILVFIISSMMLSISVLSLLKFSWIYWFTISIISLLTLSIIESINNKKTKLPDNPKNDSYFKK